MSVFKIINKLKKKKKSFIYSINIYKFCVDIKTS